MNSLLEGAGLLLVGFLWGGIPTAYLVARALRGVDIRRVGTGNVGASNVTAVLGARAGAFVALADALGKGALPVYLAGRLGVPPAGQVALALGLVGGHNWSPFLGFTGGRGIAVAGGILLGLGAWWELGLFLLVGVGVGKFLLRRFALWVLVSLAGLPVVSLVRARLGEEPAVWPLFFALLLALVVAKRLHANGVPPPRGWPLREVLRNRLLHDRDLPPGIEWRVEGLIPPEGRGAPPPPASPPAGR